MAEARVRDESTKAAPLLTSEDFIKRGLTPETKLPIPVPSLSHVEVLKGDKPYEHMVDYLKVPGREPIRIMVDSGLTVAAVARLFEDTRSAIEKDAILPFFHEIAQTLKKSSNPEVKRYQQTLQELLEKDEVVDMSG